MRRPRDFAEPEFGLDSTDPKKKSNFCWKRYLSSAFNAEMML